MSGDYYWPLRSTAFIGPLASLVRLPGGGISGGSLSEDQADVVTLKTTATGRVVAQVASKVAPRRTWSVSLQSLPQGYYAGLSAIAAGAFGYGPHYFVSPASQAQNLVTPDDSLMSQLAVSGWVPGGAVVLPDGALAPGSLVRTGSPTDPVKLHAAAIPSPPGGGNVTCTAWMKGTAGTSLVVRPAAADGTPVGSWTDSVPLTDPSGWNRLSITVNYGGTYPGLWIGTDVTATQVAAAQVTWTDTAMPYAPGSGCSATVLTGLGRALSRISATEGAFQVPTFTVTEVG